MPNRYGKLKPHVKKLLFITLLAIPWLPSFAQDSLKFSIEEVRQIALQQADLRECTDLLRLEQIQSEYCDSMVTVLDDMVQGYRDEVNIKDRIITLERNRAIALEGTVRQEKKRTALTIGIASVITALSLFIAIK